jgi:RNA polymerase sigma-70 factor (ECF subfamily)
MMLSEDRESIERILAGEPEVFEALVRKYNRMAGAIAFGIVGDFHEAEDVVQDAFIKAFRSLSALREPGKFKFWLAGMVRTKALDCLRKRHGVRAASSLDQRLELPDGIGFRQASDPEEAEVREENRQKVVEALESLPAEDRLVVVLKHMEGLSYKEISEITGSTVGAIESRLFRARQLLKKKLDPTKT